MRVAMVTNIPAPYRLPVYERLAALPGIDFCVFFFSGREPDRAWDLPSGQYRQVFLRENFFNFRNRFIHFNPDLWQRLKCMRPDVVITTGFNPSHLIAFAYTLRFRVRHIAMTDGTLASEAKLSTLHRLVRRVVYRNSGAFIGASDGAMALYDGYGIARTRMFKSHLCADNAAFMRTGMQAKCYDFIFCGRFVAVKNPFFAIDVAVQVARKLGRKVSILFVGDGELRQAMQDATARAATELNAEFAGFATQAELPQRYGSALIFLFPTLWDPWGVVANEACAAGLPVLVSPVAGVVDELVVDAENGYVLPLETPRWVDAAARLLTDPVLYATMSARSRLRVADYNYDHAAAGIAAALNSVQNKRRRVLIVQRRMTSYRVPLFDCMRAQLDRAGIELCVVYGDGTAEEQQKHDSALLPWGVHVPCTYWFRGRLCWQNVRVPARGADLIVVTQENKLLFNYVLGITPGKHMAFWGHGKNFQAKKPDSLRERMKRWWMTRADWWFAYTQLSADVIIKDAGFASERVTVLNNSIDTHALSEDLAAITLDDLQSARTRFGIAAGPIGIMVASLHADKQIDFLISAARAIRAAVPDFQLLIVGDGPERGKILRAIREEPQSWIRWLGARDGRDKASLLKMARVVLNPGMVGLGILDAFVAELPMVTSTAGQHSPEIAYLENGINGLMVRGDVAVYAAAVVALLNDPVLYATLQDGCRRARGDVSLEKMVDRFCEGIRTCLDQLHAGMEVPTP